MAAESLVLIMAMTLAISVVKSSCNKISGEFFVVVKNSIANHLLLHSDLLNVN